MPTKPPCTRIPIADASILVVGTARNCAGSIKSSIAALESATAGFRQRRFFIVESDSTDSTCLALAKLEREGRIAWQSLGKLSERYPLRTERIAHCRQHIVDYVRSEDVLCDYVINADLDGVNASIERAGLESGWTSTDPWDVLTANQDRRYYDIWALRHPQWSPDDCWQAARQLTPLFGRREAERIAVFGRQAHLLNGANLIEVDSAFGGLAIYRTEAFLAGHYAGVTAEGHEVCEHVPFHAAMRSQGFRIYINPAMKNSSPVDHSSNYFIRNSVVFINKIKQKLAHCQSNSP